MQFDAEGLIDNLGLAWENEAEKSLDAVDAKDLC